MPCHGRSPPSAASERSSWPAARGGTACASGWRRSAGGHRPRAAGVLDATLERLEPSAATRLTFATWHGDWGPWNLRSTPDRLLVWDWERSSDGVPVGFDLLHLGYHTALQGLGQPSEVAAATGRDRAAPLLAELGQHRGVEELLLDLYLLERLCRVAEAAVSAVTGRPDQAGPTCSRCSGGGCRQPADCVAAAAGLPA